MAAAILEAQDLNLQMANNLAGLLILLIFGALVYGKQKIKRNNYFVN